MGYSCAAFNCTNRRKKDSGISFHKFPLQNRELLSKWLCALKREKFTPSIHHRVCSVHFTESCFWKSIGNRLLKDNAVPSIFNFPAHLTKIEKPPRRTVKRKLESDCTETRVANATGSAAISIEAVKSDHNYTYSPTKQCAAMEIELERKNVIIKTLRLENSTYKRKNDRQEVAIDKMNQIIKDLKDKEIANEHALAVMNGNFSEVMLHMISRASGDQKGSYSDLLKKFAITMHFYSPAAYEYLRQNLNNSLPHVNTLRKWYNTVRGDPGFTEEAFLALEERSRLSSNPIWVCLMFDEMSIKKCIDWDGKEFVGYVNLGDGVCLTETEEAKEALVLMVVALNASWKTPIGYYLTNGLSADVKKNIVEEAIRRLHSINLTVVSVTCDGLSSNISVGTKLGGSFSVETFDPSFRVDEHTIQMMLDACHMIKLIRNLFGDLKILRDYQGREINWKYIELLQDIQTTEGLTLANKVSRLHINYSQQKMKVKLAVQVLSASVGNALLFLCKDLGHSGFQDAEATAEFCLFFDKIFDFCNSRNKFAKGYKAVLSQKNKVLSFQFLDFAEEYLLGLKDGYGTPLFQTARKTGIIGFLSLCRGMKNIFADLIETGKMNYLATYKFSQDHVELLFSKIRSRLGFNNNPSALQFKAAYKHLLVANEVKNKATANVTERGNTQLLPWCGVSKVHVEPATEDPQCFSHARRFHDNSSPPEEQLYSPFFLSSFALSEYTQNVVVYIAGYVVKQISKRMNCDTCGVALYGDASYRNEMSFLLRKTNGGLHVPSNDVVTVCRLCEKYVRLLLKENNGVPPRGLVALHVKRRVLEQLTSYTIFSQLHDHVLENEYPENHILRIVHLIIDLYVKIRCYHTSKTYSISLHKKIVRQHLSKSILFMNQ